MTDQNEGAESPHDGIAAAAFVSIEQQILAPELKIEVKEAEYAKVMFGHYQEGFWLVANEVELRDIAERLIEAADEIEAAGEA